MHPRRLLIAAVCGSVVLCTLGEAVAAQAEGSAKTQFLLLDETIEYKDNWQPNDPAWVEKPSDGFYMSWLGEHFRQRRSKEIPDSWLAPHNFAEGKVYTRVEVLKKPDHITTSGVILRMTTEEHAGNHTFWLCTKTCKFTQPGVYHYEENVADGTRPYGKDFRFDLPVWELQVIVTDNKDGIVHKKWEGGYAGKPNMALYLPLTVRVSTFVVAKGASFEPPPWWKQEAQTKPQPQSWEVASPDGSVGAVVQQDAEGKLLYTVTSGKGAERRPVLAASPLGLVRDDVDFTSGLVVAKAKRAVIKDAYTLAHGKQGSVKTAANELVLTTKHGDHTLDVIFRAYNDGIAYRYRNNEPAAHAYTVKGEASGFQIPPTARAWLLPNDDASQWTPSYEGYWSANVAAGTTSPTKAGWSLPALFAVNGDAKSAAATWVMLAESDLQRGWAGTRLAAEAKHGLYTIRYPDEGEGAGLGAVHPSLAGQTQSPWRVIFVAPSLQRLLQSTLVTDVATAKIGDFAWAKAGRASWSWWSDTTGGSERLRAFIDQAHAMGWEYSLVDAGWDRLPEGELKALAAYAQKQKVRLWLWYNSGGPNNTVQGTPRDRMTDPKIRRAEMKRLHDLGIAGVKIDFFHSDKPVTISQYLDILQDAAAFKLMVNFHGCTMPRGWDRTYPNLMSMEANRGEEMYKSDKEYPERGPVHQLILPFARNVVGPMDFTPVGLSFVGHKRLTTDTYELAEAVVYESGVIHFADHAKAYAGLPPAAQAYLRGVPARWDELQLLSGFPGEHIILARRAGKAVYVAGMSAASKPQSFAIEVPYLQGDKPHQATLLSDDADGHVQAQSIMVIAHEKLSVPVAARGGFVLILPSL